MRAHESDLMLLLAALIAYASRCRALRRRQRYNHEAMTWSEITRDCCAIMLLRVIDDEPCC